MNNHDISAYGTRIYLKAKAVKAVVTRERITVSVEESRKSRRGFVQNWKFNRHSYHRRRAEQFNHFVNFTVMFET